MFLVRTIVHDAALTKIEQLERTIADMKGKYDLEEKKAVVALEARLQRETTEMKSKYEQQLSEIKVKHSEEKAELRSDLAEQHYDKLSDSMTQLHEQGNATTKFMEKMVVSMTDAYGVKGQVTENLRITNVDK